LTNLIGTYTCKSDAKGRLMLPTMLKKQLMSVLDGGFVLKRSVFQPCIEMYPMQEWQVMMEKVNKLNRFVKKNNDFIRVFTAGVKIADLDVTGRLLIPKDLAVFAGIESDIILSSAVNIVEIWDKNKYEIAINEATADFATLAETVMGNSSNLENGLS